MSIIAHAPEQYPDSYIAEQGAGMGQIANPHLRDDVILRTALPIPRGSTELGQPIDPRTAHRETGSTLLGELSVPDERRAGRPNDPALLEIERGPTQAPLVTHPHHTIPTIQPIYSTPNCSSVFSYRNRAIRSRTSMPHC